jgi:mono/diheme cytochrome c family protein
MKRSKMHHNMWLHIGGAIIIALVAMLLIRLHNASGAALGADSVMAGRRLADAWCKTCHTIDTSGARTQNGAPDFAAVANMPSTTELSLKVFLQSNHRNMPNLMLTPEQQGDLVTYILSLKRN